MNRIKTCRHIVLATFMITSVLTSCSDSDIISFIKGSDEVFMEEKDLYGLWDIDLDFNPQYNLARLGYQFSANDVIIDYDIYDLDNDKLLEETKHSDWGIEKNYQGFAEHGVTGDAIRIRIDGEQHYWMVKDIWKDSIKCFTFMPDLEEPIEITMYRAGSKEDVAPVIDEQSIRNDERIAKLIEEAKEEPATNANNANWMYEKVKRDIKVCRIAIPGTHDSGTSGVGPFTSFAAKTQEKDLADQWNIGVRTFDLRVRNKKDNGDPYIFHNFIPCDLSYKDAITTLLRKAAGSKECAFVFINTEDNKLGGKGWIGPIADFFLLAQIDLDFGELDEMATRKKVYDTTLQAEAQVMREYGLKDNIIIGYRPDLTMKEAEGKLIFINRLPGDQQKKHYPFLGSALLGDFDGLKNLVELKQRNVSGAPSDTIVYKNCIRVNDLYNNEGDMDEETFFRRKLAGIEELIALGNDQRITNPKDDVTDILYFNSVSAGLCDCIVGKETPLPDYVSVAHAVCPTAIERLNQFRTSGIISMDFAGCKKFGRLNIKEVATIIAVMGPHPSALIVFRISDAAKPKKTVYGDELMTAIINQTNPVKLDSIRIDPHIITNAKPKDEYKLRPLFYPADADDRNIKSWTSSCDAVASVSKDGLLQVKKIGNTRISAITEGGARHAIYVVAPDPRSKMEAVDLGLSVLWADRNIGAANPEWDGYFYTWGDIKEQLHNYVPSEYLYGSSFDKYLKYGPNSLPYLLSLDNADDAAWYLGNGWRMPTRQEVEELIDLNSDVEWEADELNGVKGFYVSGEGNAIFLPATGYLVGYDVHHDQPNEGYFWTRDIFKTAQIVWEDANCLYIRNSTKPFHGVANNRRYYGLPIRPVKDKK